MQPIHTQPTHNKKMQKTKQIPNHPHASNGHVNVQLSLRLTLNGTLIKRILKLSLGKKKRKQQHTDTRAFLNTINNYFPRLWFI